MNKKDSFNYLNAKKENIMTKNQHGMSARELRQLLDSNELTIQALADGLDINRKTVERWLSGHTKIHRLQKYAILYLFSEKIL